MTRQTDLQSLQCSGGKPCENCLRRQKHCELPARDLAIKLDLQTPSLLLEVRNGFRNIPLSQSPPFDKQTRYVSGFFKGFLARNSFTGRPPSYCLGMQGGLASLDSLLNIVSAIGALQTPGIGQSLRGFQAVDALYYYKAAVASLQTEITQSKSDVWPQLAWSIFFMGLFEVSSVSDEHVSESTLSSVITEHYYLANIVYSLCTMRPGWAGYRICCMERRKFYNS